MLGGLVAIFCIIDSTQRSLLSNEAVLADTFKTRLKGLLGKKKIEHPLIIKPCNQIHSFFMQFAFDAVFINKEKKVVYTISRMKPFKVSPLIKEACAVIELPEGTVEAARVTEGDLLEILSDKEGGI